MRTVSLNGKLPRDFREILSWWSTSRELAEALGIPNSMVRQWKMRNSIPANFWAAICETAIAERNNLTTRELALLIDFRNIDQLQVLGGKLYAVEYKKGRFKDIQTYKRAKGQDIKRQEALEQGLRDWLEQGFDPVRVAELREALEQGLRDRLKQGFVPVRVAELREALEQGLRVRLEQGLRDLKQGLIKCAPRRRNRDGRDVMPAGR